MKKMTIRVSDEAYDWMKERKGDRTISGLGGFLLDKLGDPKQQSGHIRAWLSQILR